MVESESSTIQQGPVDSVERTIADTVLGPGETTSVTVTAEFSEAVGPSVIETIDPAVAAVAFRVIVPETDLTAIRGSEELVVIHEDVNSISLTYQVTLPENAQDGETVTLDGLLETESTEVAVPGEATIEIGRGDGLPALPGQENPPRDTDGDGLYEDVNGDGAFDITDVQVFFQHHDADVVQDNPEAFNFAGNEPADVSIGDVQALFELFQDQD